MRIHLASTSIDEIRWAMTSGLADGVFTTPSMMVDVDDDDDERALIESICRVTALPVSVAVRHVDEEQIYRDGRELGRISDQVVVQIPFVEDAMSAMRRLRDDGVRVAATLVFSAAQALLASKVGASAVITNVPQLEAQGDDPVRVVREMRAALEAHDRECDVIAAFVRTPAQFAAVAIARADGVAIDASTLRALMLHPLTDRGMDAFLGDLSRRPRPRTVP